MNAIFYVAKPGCLGEIYPSGSALGRPCTTASRNGTVAVSCKTYWRNSPKTLTTNRTWPTALTSKHKPVHLHLTAGNIHDVTEAEVLIEKAQGKNFIADKGYDADRVIEAIEQKKMIAVIPSKTNRKIQRQIDRDIYKERHWVENFFAGSNAIAA